MLTKNWRQKLMPYAQADNKKAWSQILNTLVPYFALVALMAGGIYLNIPYILVLLLSIPTAGFMVRAFILFHDCTHLSFFKTKKANQIAGHLLSIIAFTPYTVWQSEHNAHHGAVGNLDQRGIGDVWTMTVEEYLKCSKFEQFRYRLYRHPAFLFFVAPFFLFAVLNRLPSKHEFTKKSAVQAHKKSLLFTNTGLLLIAVGVSFTLGLKYYLLIQIPVLFFASVMGVWLFFVQHQFDEVYWERHEQWDIVQAALEGSSFYQLPAVLDWFSGYIGYHHIHHLNPRIPNYHLKPCDRDINEFKASKTITLFESFKMALLNLYDEKTGQLIRIKDLRQAS